MSENNITAVEQLSTRCGELGQERDVALGELSLVTQQRDGLLAACEDAYKEGYANGYADGINADESCVPETTYFKNDFTKAWNQSDTKAAIAKCQKSEVKG